MEPGVATLGNRWQMGRPQERLKQAKPAAAGCDRLPETSMVRRWSTVQVRQRALGFFLLRPCFRCLDRRRLVHARQVALGGRLRAACRGGADPGQLRQHHPPPARPQRRSPPQADAAHDRPRPAPHRRRDEALHRPPHQRRQKRTRGRALPQALPHPLALPTTGGDAQGLTVIEASLLHLRSLPSHVASV
jgi:hypothetical protein